jgi:uncharacterized protein YhdP
MPDETTRREVVRADGFAYHTSRVGRAFAHVLVATWIIFATLVVVLRYLVLPHIGDYKADIERIASKASGETVRIGMIDAAWHGLRPSLMLKKIEVVDAQGTRVLELPSVDATLSWESLALLELRLSSLDVDGLRLTVRRDAEGQLYVAGFALKKKETPDNKAGEWLFAQNAIRIRHAQLAWHDEMDALDGTSAAGRPDLVLTDVDFAIQRSGWTHHIALRGSPPGSLAAPLDLRATINHRLFAQKLAEPADWSGEVYANVATGDVVAWRAWFPVPSTLDAGHGRARVWMRFNRASEPAGSFAKRLAERIKRPIPAALDRIADVTADLALDDVAVRWGAIEYAAVASIDGRLTASQTATEQKFAATHMALQPRVGAKVPPTDFEMHRTIGATLDDESGMASLGAVDIGVSLGLVPSPLVPPAIAERLATLKPRGVLEKMTFRWTGPVALPKTFQADARFTKASVAAQQPTPEAIEAASKEIVGANGLIRKPHKAFGQPGFDNLDGTLSATRMPAAAAGGAPITLAALELKSSDVIVTTPGLFDEPTLRLAHLAAQVGVRLEGPDVEVKIEHGVIDNADLAATVGMTFRHGPKSGGVGETGGRGWLDLDARLSRAEVGRVPRYLPNVIGERARAYLTKALISGKITEASFRMHGALERLDLRAQAGALATPNPVSVPNALIAIRDRNDQRGADRQAVGGKPAGNDDTIFHALIKVQGATFLYGPTRDPDVPANTASVSPSLAAAPVLPSIPWPAFEDLDADIVFDHALMTVHARTARVYGYKLTDVTAELPALADPAHVLRVVGKGTGPLQDLVRFINNSPISRWLRKLTDTSQANGNAALSLALDLPLTHPRDAEVAGSVQFADNELTLNALAPPFTQIAGRLDFSDRGLTISNLTAQALGGPLRVDATTHSDGIIELNAAGSVDVGAMRASTKDGNNNTPPIVTNAVERASQILSGSAHYGIALRVRSKRVADLAAEAAVASNAAPVTPLPAETKPDLVVESDLAGLAIDLPAPLGKTAAAMMPLRIELSHTAANASSPIDNQEVHVSLADVVDARVLRVRDAQGDLKIKRAAYLVGAGKASREGPSEARVDLPVIDVDAWRDAIKQIAAPRTKPANATVASDALDNLLPQHASLKTASLRASGREFTQVEATVERMTSGWQGDITSDQVAGHVSYTDVSGHAETSNGVAPVSSGRVVARLSRLTIPQSHAGAPGPEEALDATKAKDFPAIDVVVDRFELRGRSMGRLEVVAENVGAGSGRAWQLEKLGLTTPEARFTAKGAWSHEGDVENTHLDFDLQASDVGALMDRFGLTRTIKNGTAHLNGNVGWSGGPSTIDLASMEGSIKLEADKGQFLKADPGIAKLLNVLSLQGLPRRLTLDFNDVFAAGFAFDTVRADATVNAGIAKTDNFVMSGVQATVRMAGSADLARETTNIHVLVLPQINAGAASLGVAVINPVIGLATFVAQYLFKDKISQALSFEYNVIGPWAKPEVTKIDRNGKATPVVPRKTTAAREETGGSATTEHNK